MSLLFGQAHVIKPEHAQYLEQWLSSDQAVPPLLIAGATPTQQLQLIQNFTKQFSAADTHCLVTDKATITVEAVRTLLMQLSRRAFDKRLVSIPEAEKLSLPAINALLKATEEPDTATRWLVMTQFPRQLVATLRSRCHIIAVIPATVAPPSFGWEPNLLKRLAGLQGQPALTDDELAQLATRLSERLRHDGPTPVLKRAFFRLRDYYKIRSRHGNEKLARDVLFASLP